jgi:cell division protease FtsH
LWIALLLLGNAFLLSRAWSREEHRLSYGQFRERLEQGELKELVLTQNSVRGLAREPPNATQSVLAGEQDAEGSEWVPFVSIRPEDPALIADLGAAHLDYSVESAGPSPWAIGAGVALLGAPVLVLLWMLRESGRAQGSGLVGFGRSRAKLAPETGTGVTFEDVAGCDEAKADLREMVEFLRDPQRFRALGARIPKGVLLLGPPGTGKTLLARAVAGEAAVPFYSINGSDFVEMFVGVGAARVRDLFVQAKERAPSIVFIDEIDAVGRQRGVSLGVVNDEREQTLNQLLSELDGFEENFGVIVLAATNRPDVLDRALLRPGRFDRQVVLDAPDRVGREAILRVHARDKPLAGDVDLARTARATSGMSGADLANALNEAALAAARERRSAITAADIEQAIERVLAGPERRSRRLCEAEKLRVAYHESGHALVAASSRIAEPVQKISIVPRGKMALGYTLQVPREEQYLRNRTELVVRLRVLLAGRAAEELACGDASTGSEDDLETATALARQMVCLFGMSARIGLGRYARLDQAMGAGERGVLVRDCSEAVSSRIDEEVERLLNEARGAARQTLELRRPALDAIARALVEHETLDRAALEELLEAQPPLAEHLLVVPDVREPPASQRQAEPTRALAEVSA